MIAAQFNCTNKCRLRMSPNVIWKTTFYNNLWSSNLQWWLIYWHLYLCYKSFSFSRRSIFFWKPAFRLEVWKIFYCLAVEIILFTLRITQFCVIYFQVTQIILKYFDTVPIASAMCVLKTGFLFVASEFGNQ